MKVVCESCQAKYQVPDERVAGKKLKIRCKRCGATVLIRGDLTQIGLAEASQSIQPLNAIADDGAPAGSGELEWHASVEGQSFGPFDTTQLLLWLEEQPNGWDAHVWRDGFSDWVEVRMVPELMAGAPASASTEQAVPPLPDDPELEEEGPTRTFSSQDVNDVNDVQVAARPARGNGNGNGTRSQELRARASSIRTRSSPSLPAAAAMPAAAAAASGWSGASTGASPRVSAAQAMTGERNEDSVLFSTSNLQQVAMTSNQSNYGAAANPGSGFASGDASGLIDIRALASLARQTTPQIAPGASQDRFRADDDSRLAVMNQTGAFNRVDSLAPVSTASSSSTAAVPLAILGGFALVAAAAFAAILITRESEPEVASVAVVPEVTAATAQPTVTPLPSTVREEPPAAAAPEPAEPEPTAAADAPEEDEELAGAKKRSRAARTGEERKETVPAEKAKPKKEEKPQPSSGEVMLASQDKPARVEKAEAAPTPAAEKPAPAAKPASTAASDIDDLLAGKPTKPAPPRVQGVTLRLRADGGSSWVSVTASRTERLEADEVTFTSPLPGAGAGFSTSRSRRTIRVAKTSLFGSTFTEATTSIRSPRLSVPASSWCWSPGT